MDFYIKASKVLSDLDRKAGSIKGLTLHSGEKSGARTYALILETLKYRDVLSQVLQKSELLVKERKLAAQGHLALVLVHDLLLNKGGIVANAGPFKDAVMRHKTRLNAEWIKAKIKLKVKDNVDLAKTDETFIPRWARINTLKISRKDLLEKISEYEIVKDLNSLKLGCVYVDEHIDNLLAFHPQQSLINHKQYLDGSLIFQNKASCLPAAILSPPKGSCVIDACAAPGNKTSQLAAQLAGTGTLFAFERDNRRVEVLRTMLAKAGADVQVTHGDFTRSDPNDAKFANVTHLLLDPSCSGSGIVNRLDYLTGPSAETTKLAVSDTTLSTLENEMHDKNLDQDRLDSLASFQTSLLLHAMKFPAARKIVYSTCSIHAIENEHVVMDVLRQNPEWTIAPRSETLPTWPVRGLVKECGGNLDIAEGLIRAQAGELGTIGFFVACFLRQGTSLQKEVAQKRSLFMSDHESDSNDDDQGNNDNNNLARLQVASGTPGQITKVTQDRSKKKKKKKKKRRKTQSDQGEVQLSKA